MPHFFINSNQITEKFINIADENIFNHLAKSLRVKIGDNVLFVDENKMQYETQISEINKKNLRAKILKKYLSDKELDFDLYLAQTPLNSNSQNFLIEKATELGIKGIYPLLTDFCSVKKNIIENKIQKYQKIMNEASKQCERATIPTCFELNSIQNLIKAEKFDKILAFVERRAKFSLKKYLSVNSIKKGEKILVIIGGEGGFSEKEIEFFEKNDIATLSLGKLILKAETAVIIALGNIIYEHNNK